MPRPWKSMALLAAIPALLAAAPPPPEEAGSANAQARQWFADARFGLFVHWGVYSLLGKGEWVMDKDRIPVAEYEKLPPRFNPSAFDAEAWVKTAKGAGMKYVTVTSKHHDGFCMFDSKLTRYDIVDATPYARDPLKALADACREHGLKLFFYYSLLDWHHPDYFPRGGTGKASGREEEGDWKAYVAYYQGQVRELCTGYGEIGGIWFDGWWDRPEADWDLEGTYKIIHDLQPGALVGNNHHGKPFPGEDFQMFEQDLPGEDPAGFNEAATAPDLPLETCLTVNESWGYNAGDQGLQEPGEDHSCPRGRGRARGEPAPERRPAARRHHRPRVHRAAARGGPLARQIRRLGLRDPARPRPPQPWGVSTHKEKTAQAFLHVLRPGPPIRAPQGVRLLRCSSLRRHRVPEDGADRRRPRRPVAGGRADSDRHHHHPDAEDPRSRHEGTLAVTEPRPPRRVDPVGALMVVVTVLALAGTAWLRYGPTPPAEPPKVGAAPPPLRLLDPDTAEPMVLIGLRGKVVWVSFWSAGTRAGRADLAELDEVWDRLKARPGFAMAAVAVEADRPEQVRAARSEARQAYRCTWPPRKRSAPSGPSGRTPRCTSSSTTRGAWRPSSGAGDAPSSTAWLDRPRDCSMRSNRSGTPDSRSPDTRPGRSWARTLLTRGSVPARGRGHRVVREVPRRPGVGSRRGRRRS